MQENGKNSEKIWGKCPKKIQAKVGNIKKIQAKIKKIHAKIYRHIKKRSRGDRI